MAARALLRVRVLGTRVREQCVAARVNGGAERASVLSREMHVIVIAHVRHDLTAQRAPPPLVAVTLSLKYLRYPPIFQLCNNRNHHRVSASQPKSASRLSRHLSISGFLFFSIYLSLSLSFYLPICLPLSLSLPFSFLFLFFGLFPIWIRLERYFSIVLSPRPQRARVCAFKSKGTDTELAFVSF